MVLEISLELAVKYDEKSIEGKCYGCHETWMQLRGLEISLERAVKYKNN